MVENLSWVVLKNGSHVPDNTAEMGGTAPRPINVSLAQSEVIADLIKRRESRIFGNMHHAKVHATLAAIVHFHDDCLI